MSGKTITVAAGDSVPVRLSLFEDDRVTPLDLSTAGITFLVRPRTSNVPLFQKRNTTAGGDDNQVQALPDPGKATVTLASADTATLRPGLYWYAVKVALGAFTYTVASGDFVVAEG